MSNKRLALVKAQPWYKEIRCWMFLGGGPHQDLSSHWNVRVTNKDEMRNEFYSRRH